MQGVGRADDLLYFKCLADAVPRERLQVFQLCPQRHGIQSRDCLPSDFSVLRFTADYRRRHLYSRMTLLFAVWKISVHRKDLPCCCL